MKKKSKTMQEFKEFAMKGNVIDMAVGVIIGGAFGKIVTSAVNDLIMPIISLATGQVNLAHLVFSVNLPGAEVPTDVAYGAFLQNVMDFLIVAICIFFAVKLMNKLAKKKEEPPKKTEEKPSKEEVLLEEIRDILKTKN